MSANIYALIIDCIYFAYWLTDLVLLQFILFSTPTTNSYILQIILLLFPEYFSII